MPKKAEAPITIRHSKPSFSSSQSNPSLAEAERKLREAQLEIEAIKNRNNEIRDAERKLKEDSIRLDKLKRGY